MPKLTSDRNGRGLGAYGRRISALSCGRDPRHIEAWMRSTCGTLDHLSVEAFADEAAAACLCIVNGGEDLSERLARSYGL